MNPYAELQTRFSDVGWQQTLDSLGVETIKEDVKNNVMRNSYVKDSAASIKQPGVVWFTKIFGKRFSAQLTT